MFFYIKNGELYNYDLNLNKTVSGRLSLILIPLGLYFLLKKKEWIKYVSNIFLITAIYGSIETYLVYLKFKKSYLVLLLIGLLHIILLYPLINIKKYLKPNIINNILGLLSILIILYWPFWPYNWSRVNTVYLAIIIYIIARILYELKS